MTRRDPVMSTAWLATAALAVAVYCGTFGLATMVAPGSWSRVIAAALAAIAVVVSLTRALSRSRTLPTVIGALMSTLILVPLFAPPDGDQRRWLPTPDALRGLGEALREGVAYAGVTVAPAVVTAELGAVLTVAALGIFLAADYLAVAWRFAATSGLVLLMPWMPAVVFQHRVSVGALFVALGAWLVVMVLSARPQRPATGSRAGTAVIAAGSTVAVAMLVAPAALGGPGWGMIPRFEAPGTGGAATRLNLALDLRTSLTTNSATPVLTYSASGLRPDTFRLYALSTFDGAAWERESVQAPPTDATSGVLWPVPVADWDERQLQHIDVSILNLAETNLPLPPTPRVVEIDGRWGYDPTRDEVVADGGSTRDVTYRVTTDAGFHERDALIAAQVAIDAGRDLSDPRYLELAPALDAEELGAVAREVTADATTRYAQALALQSYFRDTSQFTYDTTVDPAGADAVSTFLADRRGYCVQFATAMTMMARSLDIPSRIAVGFMSGSVTTPGSYVVQGGDAHAWPELWFPDLGWVRFEPTPAVQTGLPPRHADPLAGTGEAPTPEEPPISPTFAPAEPTLPAPEAPSTGGTGASQGATPAWIAVLAALVVVTIGAGAAWWTWRRRRSSATMRVTAEGVWERLRGRLPEPLRWAETLTPREVADHVELGMREPGDGLSGRGREALTKLAHEVTVDRYAPESSQATEAELQEWADTVATEAALWSRQRRARQDVRS